MLQFGYVIALCGEDMTAEIAGCCENVLKNNDYVLKGPYNVTWNAHTHVHADIQPLQKACSV